MTDHIYGEGSFIECDFISVVSVTPYSDFEERFRPEHDCFCGAEAVQVARVGFTTYRDGDGEQPWPDSITRNVKVHRCEEHGFQETE